MLGVADPRWTKQGQTLRNSLCSLNQGWVGNPPVNIYGVSYLKQVKNVLFNQNDNVINWSEK